jgi:hypothetical protein
VGEQRGGGAIPLHDRGIRRYLADRQLALAALRLGDDLLGVDDPLPRQGGYRGQHQEHSISKN